jgi:peptide/nickel transport system ATP-binding protein
MPDPLRDPLPGPLLCAEGLHVTYHTKGGSFEALHDVGLELHPGEILGVVGESGCGKSTLSSALMRLLPPNGRVTAGGIRLDHDDVLGFSAEELRQMRGARIGMVFQDPLTSLNPTFRISTQMVNAQRAHLATEKVDEAELRRRAVDMLERVGIEHAERRIDDYPHQFSGGMRQRIMVATVLLLRPEVLICDEATSALDVTLQAQILEMIKELCRERGTAVIVVTHDLGVVSSTCDRVAVLYAGRVVETGSVEDTLVRPQHPYTRRLLAAVPSRHRRHEALATIPGRVPSLSALPGGCTFAPRCDASQPACEVTEPPLVPVGGQHVRCLLEVRDQAPTARRQAVEEPTARAGTSLHRESLLVVHGLHTHFTQRRGVLDVLTRREPETVRAVDGVDLEVERGEIVGVVGESGSGKTTLGKALLNLAPLTAGSIDFDGVALTGLKAQDWRRLRSRMQMIFQETYGSLSPRLRVEQLVTEPYRINKTPSADRYPVDELLGMVGLSSEQAMKYPHELSGGQARRVGIARALAVGPELVIADEPTSGLDVSAAASVLNLLQDLRARLGLSLVLITHDLNMVGYVADRVAVMNRGRIVEIGTPGEVMDNPQHPYTKSLLASIPELPADTWVEGSPRPQDTARH